MNRDPQEPSDDEPSTSFLLWSAPTGALRLRCLLPWTLGLAALASLSRLRGDSWLIWVLGILAWVAGVFGLAWVSVTTVRQPGVHFKENLALSARALSCVLVAEVGWLSAAVLVLLVASLGTALNLVPAAGAFLFALWHYSVGLIGFFVASVMALISLALFPLLVPFAAIEPADPIAALTACMSYLRRRPLQYLLGLLGVLCAIALALVPFGLISTLAATLAYGLRVLIQEGGVPAVGDILEELLGGLRSAVGGTGDGAEPSAEFEALGYWLAAFVVVSVQVGLTRIYLILRREVDGSPVRWRPDA